MKERFLRDRTKTSKANVCFQKPQPAGVFTGRCLHSLGIQCRDLNILRFPAFQQLGFSQTYLPFPVKCYYIFLSSGLHQFIQKAWKANKNWINNSFFPPKILIWKAVSPILGNKGQWEPHVVTCWCLFCCRMSLVSCCVLRLWSVTYLRAVLECHEWWKWPEDSQSWKMKKWLLYNMYCLLMWEKKKTFLRSIKAVQVSMKWCGSTLRCGMYVFRTSHR